VCDGLDVLLPHHGAAMDAVEVADTVNNGKLWTIKEQSTVTEIMDNNGWIAGNNGK